MHGFIIIVLKGKLFFNIIFNTHLLAIHLFYVVGACSMALKKITEEYEKLANISVSNLLPNLVTKQVITHHEKQIIETKLLDSDKMMFLLDHVIVPSLRVDVCVKYNSFLEVMEKSSDILARGLAKRLGKLTLHLYSLVFIIYN